MRRAGLAFALLLVTAAGSSAQAPRPPAPRRSQPAGPPLPGPERVRILVNGGALLNPATIVQDFALTKNVETAPVRTDLALGTGGVVDIGARMRVTRTLSIGVVGFFASSHASGTLEADIPHPFYFNQPRRISGDLAAFARSERGLHLEIAYPLSVRRGREITIFGGPTYVTARQQLVTDVSYAESFPYDTATFTAPATTTVDESALGLHVGADVTWRLSRSLRGGALVRYAYAGVPTEASSGNRADLRAGGLQVAGGLRLIIQKRPPRPAAPRRR
ncbi:MAG: hypothetical protein AB7H96_02980 [Vicinamibacterales bacterium]